MKLGRLFYYDKGMMREGYCVPEFVVGQRDPEFRIMFHRAGAFEARWDNRPQEAANG